jgi:hypothetical protein
MLGSVASQLPETFCNVRSHGPHPLKKISLIGQPKDHTYPLPSAQVKFLANFCACTSMSINCAA